jgi:hypothetical protein
MNDEYDSPWKVALERYFPEFMEFYFPGVFADIDWTSGYDFLDKDLQQVTRDAELGRRYVDKLVRVRRLSGDEGWVCVHIEVQGDAEDVFARRMFTYHYRLFDRYGKPLASLAVLADANPGWHPDSFGYELFGCRIKFDFPAVKLLDWGSEIDKLLESDNAFALVTAAHLLTKKTHGNPQERYAAKIRLIRILFACGWGRQRILDLFAVLDWLISLPEDLELQIFNDIRQIEEEYQMPYVTNIERIALKKGMQQGMQQGMQEGMQKGEAQLLLRQLALKFGHIPEDKQRLIESADSQKLRQWSESIFTAQSLDEILKDS